MNKKELLVPVGNKECLIAAINNGADAVYLAGKRFGARAFADNFDMHELKEAIETCHLYGVKIYVTVNTLVYEDELSDVINFIRDIHRYGVDAVIMQDIGLINLVHLKFPSLEIHASTQMHNHSFDNIKFLEELGIKRVVFARELSIDTIDKFDTKMEKEVFIHGSLCVSYSGQCYYSKMVINRSANRGECAGMCRLPHSIIKNDELMKTSGNYLLSTRDLCTIDNFKRIMESSVYSLKIEGRMKSPLYVATVTRIYRKLIDNFYKKENLSICNDDMDLLKSIFYREYTEGHIMNSDAIMNSESSNHIGLHIGKVIDITSKKIKIKLEKDIKQGDGIRFKNSNVGITLNFIYDHQNNLVNKGYSGTEVYIDNFINLKNVDDVFLTNPKVDIENKIIKKIPINMSFQAHANENVIINISDGINEIKLKGAKPEISINNPASIDGISRSLSKLGNTPFCLDKLSIEIDDNLFIRVGDLNNLRRYAVEQLVLLRKNTRDIIENGVELNCYNKGDLSGVTVLARNKEQIKALKKYNVRIAVDNPLLLETGFYFRPARNSEFYSLDYEKVLASSCACLETSKNIIVDSYLNVTNHLTLDYLLKKAKIVTLSFENSIDNINAIVNQYQFVPNVEIYIYGNPEIMMMKSCLLKNCFSNGNCSACVNNKYYLLDRNNEKYRILTDSINHTSYLLSYKKIDLLANITDFKNIGVRNFRIDLLDETYEETTNLLNKIKKEIII